MLADAVHRAAGRLPGVVRGARAERLLVRDHAGVSAHFHGPLGVPQKVRVVALLPDETAPSAIPLLEARSRIGGRPTAYVCRDFACRQPVTTVDALEQELGITA